MTDDPTSQPFNSLYLETIEVQDFRGCSISFELNDTQSTIFFEGEPENSGRTSLLQAIALSLCHTTVEVSALCTPDLLPLRRLPTGESVEQAVIKATFLDPSDPDRSLWVRTTIDDRGILKKTSFNFPWHRVFVCGYGSNRRPESFSIPSYSPVSSTGSLFHHSCLLLDPEESLKILKLALLETHGVREIQLAEKEFHQLTSSLCRIVGLSAITADAMGATVSINDIPLPLRALGSGRRETLGWILDAVVRFHQFRSATEGKGCYLNPAGIVLVDDIERGLTGDSLRRVQNTFKAIFPKVQLLATRH